MEKITKTKKITIDKKNKTAIIRFNVQFYPLEYIVNSARAFTDSCWVYVDGDPTAFMYVSLTPKKNVYNLGKLSGEFYNYVLGAMKSRE